MTAKNEVAAQLMEHLCKHSLHGYTQGNRWGDGGVETVHIGGKGYTIATGDRDCSSAVISAYQAAGVPVKDNGATYTGNMRRAFLKTGQFEWKPMSFTAQRGDVYLKEGKHTAMCTSSSPDMLAEFSISETGGIYGKVGDQTGQESRVRSYYSYPWDGILHYVGSDKAATSPSEPLETKLEVTYRVSTDPDGKSWYSEMSGHSDKGGSGDDYAGVLGKPIRWVAMNMSGWYQVETEDSGWLEPVRGYDIGNLDSGCAGDGSPITSIRCYYETQDHSATGWIEVEYQVHTVDGKWLSPMRDLSDTSGSSDNYAGNGRRIDGFRARLVK